MTETKLLADTELQAWVADEPPSDFAARLLDRLDASEGGGDADGDAGGDAAPVIRLEWPAQVTTMAPRWPTMVAVAAAAGLVLWLAQPNMAAPDDELRSDHAAAHVAGDATSEGHATQSPPPSKRIIMAPPKATEIPVPPAPSLAPPSEPVQVAPRPPAALVPPGASAPRVPGKPPADPSPDGAPPASPSPAPPSAVVPPAPAPVPAAHAPAPAAPAPLAEPPKLPGPQAVPKPPAPSAAGPTPTKLGLHIRADESTNYRLRCVLGDSDITLVRGGDLDIEVRPNESPKGLVYTDGELVFNTNGPTRCTIHRRTRGTIEAITRTTTGGSRVTLEPPARKIIVWL